MNVTSVGLMWDYDVHDEIFIHISLEEEKLMSVTLSHELAHQLEDVMIDYIGDCDMKHYEGILCSVANTIHDNLGNEGFDAVLSGVSTIVYKMDMISKGEDVYEKKAFNFIPIPGHDFWLVFNEYKSCLCYIK